MKNTGSNNEYEGSDQPLGLAGMSRYSSQTAMLDFLFNTLLLIFMMFVIAFLLISKSKKREDINFPADTIITLSWTDKSADDLDLMVETPAGDIVNFTNREANGVHLDRDDLGRDNDELYLEEGGELLSINKNWEHITVRGSIPGKYIVNVLSFSKLDSQPITAKIKVERLNPHELVYEGTKTFTRIGQEETFVQFELMKKGKARVNKSVKKSLISKFKNIFENQQR